jgi:hypothetical protein
MRVIARRADVLHGEFIQPDGSGDMAPVPSMFAVIERYILGSRLPARR